MHLLTVRGRLPCVMSAIRLFGANFCRLLTLCKIIGNWSGPLEGRGKNSNRPTTIVRAGKFARDTGANSEVARHARGSHGDIHSRAVLPTEPAVLTDGGEKTKCFSSLELVCGRRLPPRSDLTVRSGKDEIVAVERPRGGRGEKREEFVLLLHDLRFAGAAGAAERADFDLVALDLAGAAEAVAGGVAGDVALVVELEGDRMFGEGGLSGEGGHLPRAAGEGE